MSSDIYINEIHPNYDNNNNLNDNLNNNRVGLSGGNTVCDTMNVEDKDDEIIDELLYSFKNFSNEKNDEQKKLFMFEFIDYVLLDKQ